MKLLPRRGEQVRRQQTEEAPAGGATRQPATERKEGGVDAYMEILDELEHIVAGALCSPDRDDPAVRRALCQLLRDELTELEAVLMEGDHDRARGLR